MSEDTQNQEVASVIIDGVTVSADELSDIGRIYLARMQRLNQKRVVAVVDIEEMDAALRHFEALLIQDYQGSLEEAPNSEGEVPAGEVVMPEVNTEETESEESADS